MVNMPVKVKKEKSVQDKIHDIIEDECDEEICESRKHCEYREPDGTCNEPEREEKIMVLIGTVIDTVINPYPDNVHLDAHVYDGLKREAVEEFRKELKTAFGIKCP